MSIIDEYVNELDLESCSAKLINSATSQMQEANIASSQLAQLTGISEDRINALIENKGTDVHREEINVLCLATGMGLDIIFDLPNLSDPDDVRNEFDLMQNTGHKVEAIAFCGPLKNENYDLDTVRSLLYLYCLRRCLLRYPSHEKN